MKNATSLKTLYTKEKPFSLRGRLYFFDEKGSKQYEAVGELDPYLGHRIFANNSQIAYVQKEAYFTKKFSVETYFDHLDHFTIHAYQFYPLTFKYEVLSGKYKGALLSGGLFYRLEMTHQNQKLFRFNRNRVELLCEDKDIEILAVIVRTLLYINMKQE